jgi:hypothetical protein
LIFVFYFSALFRDVPLPDEVKGAGNFMPLMAENGNELIDWALSHIPKSFYSFFTVKLNNI